MFRVARGHAFLKMVLVKQQKYLMPFYYIIYHTGLSRCYNAFFLSMKKSLTLKTEFTFVINYWRTSICYLMITQCCFFTFSLGTSCARTIGKVCARVGFLPTETYFCLDSDRNLVSHSFFYFLPAEMRETQDGISHINMLEMKGIQDN